MAKLQLAFCKQQGFSLVELMIAMVISLVVLSGAVSFIIVNAHFGAKHLQQDYLRAKLTSLAFSISSEIERAGFCFNCSGYNPYQLKDKAQNTASILIDDSATKLLGSCLRFAYNYDKRNKPNKIDKNDARGFRLGKDANGKAVIEIYENWQGLYNWHCTSEAGYAGYWQDMTISGLVLETFQFSRVTLQALEHRKQLLRLEIAGFIKGNSDIREKIIFDINVANVDF